MPQRDRYHHIVRNALIKDGWTITHDPFVLPFGTRDVFIDLGAEAQLGAEKEGRKIAVEIKTFLGLSEVTDLERALGQFTLYRYLLTREDPARVCYVALPEEAYNSLFTEAVGREMIPAVRLKLIVFIPATEVIKQWIE